MRMRNFRVLKGLVAATAVLALALPLVIIVGIRFGRILDVDLTVNPHNRSLVVQPVAYTDGYVVVHENAPSTDGQVGRVAIVR